MKLFPLLYSKQTAGILHLGIVLEIPLPMVSISLMYIEYLDSVLLSVFKS